MSQFNPDLTFVRKKNSLKNPLNSNVGSHLPLEQTFMLCPFKLINLSTHKNTAPQYTVTSLTSLASPSEAVDNLSIPILASTPVMGTILRPAYNWASWSDTGRQRVWTRIRLSPVIRRIIIIYKV